MSSSEAYAACLRIAREHYENFPVASWLVPATIRPHVAAVYAFARIADDYADEPGRSPDQRLALLADWRERLHRAAPPARAEAPATVAPQPVAVAPAGPHPLAGAILAAVGGTMREFDLPIELFDDLIDAFEQDVVTTRYQTWAEVDGYCSRSANPVGRLVLRLFGYRDLRMDRASDAFCTALQLTNFWQDLGIDWARGRLYVPGEVWRRHGADPASLDGRRVTTEWAAALRECADRTRGLYAEGRPVCDMVSGRLAYELRATWLGGARILDRLERHAFDVFGARPTLSAVDGLVIACRTLVWRRAPDTA